MLDAIDSAFNDVAQFADVAGPAVTKQRAFGSRRKTGEVLAPEFLGHALGKFLREQDDVVATLAQRRYGDDVERQAVEQVLTKLAGTRHRRKIDVGGTDQTNIDLDRFTGTDSLHLAVFNDQPQQQR